VHRHVRYFRLAPRLQDAEGVKRIRRIALATLLGAGCAAPAARAPVARPEVVAIAPDLAVTCGPRAHDHFAYDPALHTATSCRRIDDDVPELVLHDDASAAERERAIAEFLTGVPTDAPVDRHTVATAIHRAATAE
jgi:hypothetical protein